MATITATLMFFEINTLTVFIRFEFSSGFVLARRGSRFNPHVRARMNLAATGGTRAAHLSILLGAEHCAAATGSVGATMSATINGDSDCVG